MARYLRPPNTSLFIRNISDETRQRKGWRPALTDYKGWCRVDSRSYVQAKETEVGLRPTDRDPVRSGRSKNAQSDEGQGEALAPQLLPLRRLRAGRASPALPQPELRARRSRSPSYERRPAALRAPETPVRTPDTEEAEATRTTGTDPPSVITTARITGHRPAADPTPPPRPAPDRPGARRRPKPSPAPRPSP
ncbi:hypothetical protein ANANG_G00025410 [Anguilla anguilla]|uniref:Uncharacterized protein n=1 Tax=Anguilla anguilla TaxID=7936 RepID=A0A9D3SB37_ANGAN|nr:hypothetical protein ANANG_G00025410 [Anguilla anguilla]